MNKRRTIIPMLIILSIILISIHERRINTESIPKDSSSQINEIPLGKFFGSDSLMAHFSLYDKKTDKYLIYNKEVFEERFPPASTFKILNSLIAFETGIIPDTNETYKWDGKKRGWKEWDKDHNIASAMRVSALWFYQRIARKLYKKDPNAYQNYIQKSGFGNRKISEDIDLFWFDGSLLISPKEQIDFLQKLESNNLPFSSKTIESTKEIIVVKSRSNYTLRGKTGIARVKSLLIGWYIGYVVKEDQVYFFCTNIQKPSDQVSSIGKFRSQYLNTTYEILSKLEVTD